MGNCDISKQKDISLLCMLADIAIAANKDSANKAAEATLSLLRNRDYKRLVPPILALTGNNDKHFRSSKSDFEFARHIICWAKENKKTMQKNKCRNARFRTEAKSGQKKLRRIKKNIIKKQ